MISEEALNMVNVAQLVRALDCGSKGRGFESHLSPIHSFTRLSRFERGSLSVSMPIYEPKRWVFESGKFHLGLFFLYTLMNIHINRLLKSEGFPNIALGFTLFVK